MPCCQVCGQRLSLRAFLAGRFTRQVRTYPFPMAVGGHRKEFPVRWQCEGCIERAAEIRAEEPVLPAGATTRPARVVRPASSPAGPREAATEAGRG
jgi:hypothetical protein